jgi:DNA-binding IclR family transcriptional regulator
VLADTILDYVHPKHHGKHARNGKHKPDRNGEDVAAKLLKALAGGGPRSIPQLLAETHLRLSPVLQALQTLREFRLINFVGEPGEETVEVTRSGAEAVTVFKQTHIREEAARLLQ